MKLIKVDVVTNATGNGRIGTRGTVLNVRQEEGGNGSESVESEKEEKEKMLHFILLTLLSRCPVGQV